MDRTRPRLEKLRGLLAPNDADAFLVLAPTNVRYLTGFTGDSSVLLVTADRDVLISDGRFTIQIEQECPGQEAHVRPTGTTLEQAIAHVVETIGARRLAFEAAHCTVAQHLAIAEAVPSAAMAGVVGWGEGLRAVKDEEELAAIRAAVQMAEQAFLCWKADWKPGDCEADVADALESQLKRQGASGPSFPVIVAVGARSALPHAQPTKTARIGDDDFLLVDWGADGGPYKSDLTRLVVTGKVTPTFEEIYQIVLTAQERAIAAIRPGVSARAIDALARSVIEGSPFGACFNHGLGHGLGMDIHEAPRLGKSSPDVLEPGNVVTVEPGIYVPGWGGVRIEDDVLVTSDGHEVLSHLPRSLDSVRSP